MRSRSRYFFLAGGAIFLLLAGVELFRVNNYFGAVINGVTAAIFLCLGWLTPRSRQ
jgi:hypothetical protein